MEIGTLSLALCLSWLGFLHKFWGGNLYDCRPKTLLNVEL